MNILLVSLNYSPELTGIGKYNGEMCRELASKGNNVTVICAPPYYPDWKVKQCYKNSFKREIKDGVEVIRCPVFLPKKLNSFTRILHLFSFMATSLIALLSILRRKFDVSVVIQPTLFAVPGFLVYCWIKKSKSIMHIQDYELDAFQGLSSSKFSKDFRWARKLETSLMVRFDVISSISRRMLDLAEERGVPRERLVFFPNWSDCNLFNPNKDCGSIRQEWGFSSSDKIVLYSGNLGKKQGLGIILDVAKKLSKNTTIKFLIVGAGVGASALKARAEKLELSNVFFKPLVEYRDLPKLLATADVHLVTQKKGVADAVFPSKLTNILSSGGKAIVSAEEGTELYNISKVHPFLYKVIAPENLEQLQQAILSVIHESPNSKHNMLAREFAVKNIDKKSVLDDFTKELSRLIA